MHLAIPQTQSHNPFQTQSLPFLLSTDYIVSLCTQSPVFSPPVWMSVENSLQFHFIQQWGGCGGLCTVVVPPVNSHGCQWNIKLICGLCDSPRGGGLAVSLQFCPSISILILNQCGLKTYPLNWCFILNSQCSSCSASRHCETDVFSAVTNCCVYIFIVLAYDGPCSVFLPKDPGVWRECALSVCCVGSVALSFI